MVWAQRRARDPANIFSVMVREDFHLSPLKLHSPESLESSANAIDEHIRIAQSHPRASWRLNIVSYADPRFLSYGGDANARSFEKKTWVL
jgi:hypothetical protein